MCRSSLERTIRVNTRTLVAGNARKKLRAEIHFSRQWSAAWPGGGHFLGGILQIDFQAAICRRRDLFNTFKKRVILGKYRVCARNNRVTWLV